MDNVTRESALTGEDIEKQFDRYRRPAPLLVVISGPSGAGKDSVIERMQEMGIPFHFVVTATDRSPRPDERHGIDYYFVSTERFERMIEKDELFEYARVYGQYKGVPKAQVRRALASGQDVVMRVDLQGAETIRNLVPQAVSIFIMPPSIEILRSRLRRRGGDSKRQIEERLAAALQEMEYLADFDYVVVNREGQLGAAAEQVSSIIAAEKCRTDHVAVRI